jgi:YHS domain-containing protein
LKLESANGLEITNGHKLGELRRYFGLADEELTALSSIGLYSAHFMRDDKTINGAKSKGNRELIGSRLHPSGPWAAKPIKQSCRKLKYFMGGVGRMIRNSNSLSAVCRLSRRLSGRRLSGQRLSGQRLSGQRLSTLQAILLSIATLLIIVASPGFVAGQANEGKENGVASKVALNGYCPISLVTLSKWIPGESEHRIQYDGQLYYFPSVAHKQAFMNAPAKYVPTLGGDCVVCYAKSKKRVPGDLDFGVQHKGRFYFFAEKQQKVVFLANPDAYENIDLALGGNCAVCKVEMRRDVPGNSEYTTVHKGIRFLFPSEKQMSMFEASPAKYENAGKPLLALAGYCAVCLRDGNAWTKGSEDFSAVYDDREYRFPTALQRDTFLAAPQNYVPVLGGDCAVCLATANKRVEGSIFHSTYYRDRLFLFPSAEIKQQFKAAPENYVNVDLALNGNCAVCLVKGGKQVAGNPQFQHVYQGVRYLFPSDAELKLFKAEPASYVQALTKSAPPEPNEGGPTDPPNIAPPGNAPPNAAPNPQGDATAVDTSDAGKLVSIKGVSGCAGCDHGVTPLKSPKELGLAVVGADGNIYIIEEAHATHKQIYEARFTKLNLAVSGAVIQRQGKFVWLDPRAVKVLQ